MTIINDERPLDTSDETAKVYSDAMSPGPVDDANGEDGARQPDESLRQVLFNRARVAQGQATTFMDQAVRAKWARAQRAFHNQHADGSKYLSDQWKGRSKLFRPKTRTAVRKHMAAAQKSLFGTGDIIGIEAQDQTNAQQKASAAIKKELMVYRMSRTSRRNGLRWFQVAMGARQDSLLTGVCVSKQHWRYVEEEIEGEVEGIDEETGEPLGRQVCVVEDRPEIRLYPPENAMFSPACDWLDPAQSSEYLILRNHLSITEALQMIEASQSRGGVVRFDEMTFEDLSKYTSKGGASPTENIDTVGPRAARNQGYDPQQNHNAAAPMLWLHENFFRYRGKDYVFWTIGNRAIISEPVETRVAYPQYAGDRPVVVGHGSIEAHRAYPMAPVESWQPIQQEINDQVNLRLDHEKQVVTPLAKVKRGRNVDLKAVQSRGGNNGVLLLQDLDDVDYAQIPDLPQSAYVENNYLNADFDDIAGTFNAGSVQTNRSMNETVGGMQILASDANTMGDFDLNVWVETWVEPVLWQVLKCEEYYESDATILAIAGQKAGLIEKYGMNEITDTLLQQETSLTVKVGPGVTTHPQEKLQKFAGASQIFGQIAAPFIQGGANKMPSLKLAEVANEVFGAAGFPDAAERFFNDINDEPAPPQGPPPEVQAEQAKLQLKAQEGQQKLQLDQAKTAADLQAQRERMAMEREEHQQQMQMDREKFQNDMQLKQADAAARQAMQQQQMQHAAATGQIQLQQDAAMGHAKVQQAHQMGQAKIQSQAALAREKQEAMMAQGGQDQGGGAGPSSAAPTETPAGEARESQAMQSIAEAIAQMAQAVMQSNQQLAQLIAAQQQQGAQGTMPAAQGPMNG